MFDNVFLTVAVGGVAAVLVFCFVKLLGERKKHKTIQREISSADEESTACEMEYPSVETKAKVIDRGCYVKVVGIKIPKSIKVFTVIFETDDGETLKIDVPEEMYDGFEKGQVGLLKIVDGELYSFTLD